MGATARSPLPWLGAVIVAYLAVPIIAFGMRLGGGPGRGFDTPGLWPALGTSVEAATISVAVIALFGVPLAYLLAKPGRLSTLIGAIVVVPLALPPLMGGILLIYLVGPYTWLGRLFGGRLTESVMGVVLAQTFVAAPFVIVSARSAFKAIDPSLFDVAATLGHSELSRFRRVAVPLAADGIRAGMLLGWLRAFGEYGATVLLSYHPFSLPVYTYNQFSGFGLPTTTAPTALALGVAVVATVVSRLRPPRRTATWSPPEAIRPQENRPARPVGFDLDLRLGEFHLELAHPPTSNRLGLVGPSGSGKSTLLRCVAGLKGARPGSVSFGERAVQCETAESRRVGYLAQGFSLFPHLTVWEQLLFPAGATGPTAAYWYAALRLDGLAGRYPSELSGGQRQRVALAQALCRSPDVLLLDEPLSALDTPVRHDLRRTLRQLQRDTGLATVVVTHDPEEAAYLADELIVIDRGRALQAGPTRQLFSAPASPPVARLLGVANVSRGRIDAGGNIDASGTRIETSHALRLERGAPVLWKVDPLVVSLTSETARGLPAVVTDVAELGTSVEYSVRLNPKLELRARRDEPLVLSVGEICWVQIPPDEVKVWTRARSAEAILGAR